MPRLAILLLAVLAAHAQWSCEREPEPADPAVAAPAPEPEPVTEPPSPETAKPDEAPATRIIGRVRDPYTNPLPGATARVLRPDESEALTVAISDEQGAFELPIASLGRYRVEIEADGCAPFAAELNLEVRNRPRSLLVELEPVSNTTIEGRVVSTSGDPLLPADLYALLPRLAPPDAPRDPMKIIEFTQVPSQAPSDVYAVPAEGVYQEYGRFPAVFDDQVPGRFTIEVPSGFTGTVALMAKGDVVSRATWVDGDAAISLPIGVGPYRDGAAGVIVDIFDERTGEIVPDTELLLIRRTDNPLAADDTSGLFDPELGTVVEGLVPGRYTLIAYAEGFVAAPLDLDAPAFAPPKPVSLGLRPAATVRVLLDEIEPPPVGPGVPGEFQVTTRDGRWLTSEFQEEEVGGRRYVVFEQAPWGDVVLRYRGNTLGVTLRSGPNPDVVLPILAARLLVVRVQIFPADVTHARCLSTHARVILRDLASGIVATDFVTDAPIARDGWAEVLAAAVPGDYELELDFGGLRRVIAPVEITGADEESLILPLDR